MTRTLPTIAKLAASKRCCLSPTTEALVQFVPFGATRKQTVFEIGPWSVRAMPCGMFLYHSASRHSVGKCCSAVVWNQRYGSSPDAFARAAARRWVRRRLGEPFADDLRLLNDVANVSQGIAAGVGTGKVHVFRRIAASADSSTGDGTR